MKRVSCSLKDYGWGFLHFQGHQGVFSVQGLLPWIQGSIYANQEKGNLLILSVLCGWYSDSLSGKSEIIAYGLSARVLVGGESCLFFPATWLS